MLYRRLEAIGMSQPGAELVRDVVTCPGADTCNLAVTQSRGLGVHIGEKPEEEGLAEVGGLRINISGCTNSCGQHHTSDIGFFGAERRANGRSAPGYQMLLGGFVGDEKVHFGDKALRLPARNAAEATARGCAGSRTSARPASRSAAGWTGRAAPRPWRPTSRSSTTSPLPDEAPEYYVDFDETGPYEAEVGVGECAGE